MLGSRRAVPPHTHIHPRHLVRLFPLAGLILLISAMYFSHNQTLRSMSVGGVFGILVGATAFAWQIEDGTPKSVEQSPDAKSYSLNRSVPSA